MKQIVCIYAHPRPRHSKVHSQLIKQLHENQQVIVRDLYELYPDFIINSQNEQAALRMADIIIWQFPIYWYSTPAILKEWFDTVLTPDFAFGPGGSELKGKYLWPVISCGASFSSYSAKGSNNHSLKTFLLPMLQTAKYCSLSVFEPFIIDQANDISAAQLEKKTEQFRALVEELTFGKIFQPFKDEE